MARSGLSAAYSDGFIYVLGGGDVTGAALHDVQFAAVLPNGGIGPWTPTTDLPEGVGRGWPATVVYGGRLYLSGGFSGANGSFSDVWSIPILPGGGLASTWTQLNSFAPPSRNSHAMLQYRGFMYVLGGIDTTATFADIQVAAIQPDGSLGTWSPITLLPQPLEGLTAVASDGYLYIAGGWNASANVDLNTAQAIAIRPDGSLDPTWSATSTFVNGRDVSRGFIAHGYFILGGGLNCTISINPCGAYADFVSAPLGAPAAVGHYAKALDLGSDTSVDSVTVAGSSTATGVVRLAYRIASDGGTWGPSVDKGVVPLGTALRIGELGARYLALDLLLDDQNVVTGRDGGQRRDVTTLTVATGSLSQASPGFYTVGCSSAHGCAAAFAVLLLLAGRRPRRRRCGLRERRARAEPRIARGFAVQTLQAADLVSAKGRKDGWVRSRALRFSPPRVGAAARLLRDLEHSEPRCTHRLRGQLVPATRPLN